MKRNNTKSNDNVNHYSENQLPANTELFRSMFEQTPIPTNLFDLDGNIIAANAALIEFAGVSSFEELRDFNIFSDPNMSKEMKERLRNGESIRYQSEIDFKKVQDSGLYPTKRRDIACVETGMSLLRSPRTGKKLGYFVQLVDISDEKELERKLKQSQEEFKGLSDELERILDAIPGFVFYKDKKGNYIRVNEALAKAHRVTKENLEGKSTFELYPEEEAEAHFRDDMEVIESGRPKLNIVEPLTTKEGTRWVNTSKIPLYNDDGSIAGIVGISIDITEKKKAQDKLSESEKQLRKVLDSLQTAIVMIDSKTREIISVNPMVSRITGFSGEELEGAKCYDHFCLNRAGECPVIDSGQTVESHEGVCLAKDGRKIPILKTVNQITLDGDDIHLVSFVDISKQKRVEQALRESERRYRQLIDILPEGVAISGLNEQLQLVNQAMGDILGYDPDELIGESLLDFVDSSSASKIKNQTQLRKKGIESTYEIQIINAKGERRDIRLTASPRLDESGRVTGSIGIFLDITEQKESERKLRETTYVLQERMKEMEALYAVADLSKKTDVSMSEMIQSLTQIIKRAFQYPEITCVRILIEGDEYTTSNFEETQWKLDQRIWCEGQKIGTMEVYYLEKRPASDEGPFMQEEQNLLASIAIQIGEHVELRRTQARRKEQHREMELYASLLRHDLKNDIGAIVGNLDILKMTLSDTEEETNKTISSMEAVCQRMNSLLNALSRPAETVETNLYRLIKRIARQTIEEEPQLKIDINAGSDAKDARIPASRLLPMVFDNLFRNSLDFIEENPVITLKLTNENGMVEALISDNGPGVAEEIKDTLFERGSSIRDGGMGLYLSRQILEGLGGSIELVNTPSKEGATFRVTVPSR